MATATQDSTKQDTISELIDSTRSQFEVQMEELRPQHEAFLRLEGIVANFDKVTDTTAPAPARKGRTTRSGVSRPDEFLRMVTESGSEGITVTEAATRMDGMNPNYLYRIAKDHVEKKVIEKGTDKRYRAV